MIARQWHGIVPVHKADAYYQFLSGEPLHDYKGTKGNRGVYVFRHDENRYSHFYLLTLWESYNAIKAFAGEDFEKARYYPEDEDFLLEKELLVQHFEVLNPPAPTCAMPRKSFAPRITM